MLFLLASALWAVGDDGKPNVVVILADDLGYGDLGCYRARSKVPTPNLDRLAAGGLRFTQAYCPVSVCSPTRYALMTGTYPFRSWKKSGVLANWERPMIDEGRLTLPEMLRRHGYATAGFGKWHLGATYTTLDGRPPAGIGEFKAKGTGSNLDLRAPVAGGPADRGFDRWFGFICASEMLVVEDRRAAALLAHGLYAPPPVPGAKDLEGVDLSGYLPLVTDKSIAFIRERAKAGGSPFFLYVAPYVPHVPFAVAEGFRGRTPAGDYGDYVHQLDHEIGRLLRALDETGLASGTLVLFASDNGSDFEETGDGHRPNGELRGGKHDIYEGGVRTPLLARWPGRVPAGSVNDDLVALNDLLATVAALVGAKRPEGAGIDSLDLSPLLLGRRPAEPVRTEVLLQSGGFHFALRRSRWKFIEGRPNRKPPADELYDLESDPGEGANVIAGNPEIAAELKTRLKRLLAGRASD